MPLLILRRDMWIAVAVLFMPLSAAAQAPQMPPPQVSVETLKTQTVPVTYDYPGRVVASREVEVRARVGGILLARKFDEGARVKKGDLLFIIDSASYQAQVALARAQVAQAEAQLGQARRSEERARALAKSGASSQATLDDAVSARELTEAQLEAAKAQLKTAALSLDYATVEAPVAGITSLEQVPEGSLLSSGDLLTKISQIDPVYVNFAATDTEAAAIRDMVESGAVEGVSKATDLKVEIQFGDGSSYGETGRIDFTSTSIDSDTGTILSRAVMPNPQSRLLPGQFVRLRLNGLVVRDAIVIPAEALMQGPQGTFVYTLDDENVAAVAPIEIRRQIPGGYIVKTGLKAGDRLVTKGVVKVRPGAPVKPTTAPAAGSTPGKPDGDTTPGSQPSKETAKR
ncbi:efflux RND transporter periplasmic adaptor subunit [Jiella sp. MQZ9-1]|uniref:Efflux RND transporter periplasmic adaptor subunit n=1 Tax=Jiella flava TaxID=2816857 RepID=A0A939JWY5_9HYPH|nr:efflux RND transporter periplasmic adaptor subunit [Jiella flava]MBO0663502.1 efflux RND transporter periplasmic adaptor subunit [Jiella flava]MCD2472077.1 efflux RND transporter periplasmic adaptor subunit [Jiella flava]